MRYTREKAVKNPEKRVAFFHFSIFDFKRWSSDLTSAVWEFSYCSHPREKEKEDSLLLFQCDDDNQTIEHQSDFKKVKTL